MDFKRFLTGCLLILLAASTAAAQGNPTGNVSGQVIDQSKLPLPGVTVTAASAVLQGTRTAVTSENGDYIIPFLPPGDYTVTFELAGFATLKQTVRIEIGATVPLRATLTVAAVSETVTVTGSSTEITQTATVAATYKSDFIERLPMGRTFNAYAQLSPGVNDNGPNGNTVMSGAMSYENLNLVNGVVINENLRGQARNLFIEDAIQESKVSTGSISAEYGRFQGGVVNTITKSGGNRFSGSFRTTFTNDSWRSLTPYPGDQNIDDTVPTYEVTIGGPVFRDRLWFFGAARYEDRKVNITTDFTAYNFTQGNKEKRYEGKLTWALNTNNNAKFSYIKRRLDTTNNYYTSATAVLDQRSLYNNANDEELYSFNYTSVLTSTFFLEGQYSRRDLAMIGTGSQFTDYVKGTPIWDRSRNQARFNSPTFCAVCGSGVEERDNWNAFVKANYFLSTRSLGSHSLVGGFDVYKEMRKNDNYQSGSSYRIQATSAILNGTDIFPVFKSDNTTYVEHLPLVGPTQGNDIRTYSVFLNDQWRFNNRFSFNVGVRYDYNRSRDQAGTSVVKDSAWSPRLGATWDLRGDGRWKANAGFARYVMGISTAIVDAGSAGGRTATYSYFYKGPDINTGSGPYITADAALPILFNWFFTANGQTGLPSGLTTRTAPSIPGVTTKVGDGLKAPNSDEYTIGLSHELTSRAVVRVDYIHRDYRNFYGDYRDMTTGKVYEPVSNRNYDLVVVRNTDSVDRKYDGINVQASYARGSDFSLGGNYTLGWSKGSFEGESATDGPVRASANDFPEYREARWNFPVGYLNGDQRHKLRGWLSYKLPLAEKIGRVDLGLMERFDSGRAYDWNATIDTRPYVTNPGYITPTSSVTYYFSDRGGLTEGRSGVWRTDLSINWEVGLPGVPRGRLFFRGIVNNLFNQLTIDGFNTTIQTRSQNTKYAAFNPFTETPIEGVHYGFGPEYGKVTGPSDYQSPREFYFSVGFRF